MLGPGTELLDRYRIESRIAVGGTSEIFAAVGPDGEQVVVKALQTLPGAEADAPDFLAEASLTANLVHPNIVRVSRSGHHEGRRSSLWSGSRAVR